MAFLGETEGERVVAHWSRLVSRERFAEVVGRRLTGGWRKVELGDWRQ